MKTILVTGFGPFRDHLVNASWESVKLLPDEIDGYKIVKKEIPVLYNDVEMKIPALWRELNPEVKLGFYFRKNTHLYNNPITFYHTFTPCPRPNYL